jgi:hypothetical protein
MRIRTLSMMYGLPQAIGRGMQAMKELTVPAPQEAPKPQLMMLQK